MLAHIYTHTHYTHTAHIAFHAPAAAATAFHGYYTPDFDGGSQLAVYKRKWAEW